jgi:hypothetical protein
MWRTASSGGRGTQSQTSNAAFHGDLTPTSPISEPLLKTVSIECKFYKKIDLGEILRGIKGNKLLSFWQQASESARLSRRFPVVIMKSNFLPILLVIGKELAQAFVGVLKKSVPFISINNELFIANFEDTLAAIDLRMFKIITGMLVAQREALPAPITREPKRADA